MVKHISSGSDFETEFGYSRAVIDGEMIYVSGTTGYDYKTMSIPDDVSAQTVNTLETIRSVLEQAGASIRDVVQVRYYLSDRIYMNDVVKVVGPVFADIRPAATMVVCPLIREEMKIEIEVTARIGAHAS